MISQFIHGSFRLHGLAVHPIPCYICNLTCYVRSIPKKRVLCPRCAAVAHDNEKIIAKGELSKILKPKVTVRLGQLIKDI